MTAANVCEGGYEGVSRPLRVGVMMTQTAPTPPAAAAVLAAAKQCKVDGANVMVLE